MEGNGPPAALPRALDVQRFAGAREQEIRALIGAIKEGPAGGKFGVAALPRHLRRRAGSHKPFHGHRFRPNLKLQGKRRKLQAGSKEQADGAADAAAEPASATVSGAEPAAGAGVVAAQQQAPPASSAARPFTNRRMRRHPAALADQHRSLASWSEAALTGGSAAGSRGDGSSSSSTALRRLETHVWHAKRLSMEERYGWLLPAGAAGQGRGSRSFVHVAQSSSLMHDASYHCPLLLRGSWSNLLSLLSTLLSPEDAALLADDWEACCGEHSSGGSGSIGSSSGGWEQELVLYQPGGYPGGAICPAQLLVTSPDSGGTQPMETDAPASSAAGTAGAAAEVQACLWVHPAAAAEAYAALQLAEGRQQAAGSGGVSLAVLDLRRLEIRGGAADAALAVALAGATAGASQQQQQQQQQGEQQQGEGQHPRPQLPSPLGRMQHGDAVQLLLPDPRLCKPVVLGSAAACIVSGPGASIGSPPQQQQQELEQQPIDLGSLQAQPLPLSESQISSRRQQLRRRMLGLPQAAPGGGGGAAGGSGEQQQGQEEADQEVQCRGFCPAVLVRHDPPGDGGIPGWSLILPPGWSAPFWLAAAYAACKPAGQREWRWLHALQQRSCFPWDHPDTASYAALMQQQQQLRAAAAARRPKGKQMMAAPVAPPQWEQLVAQRAAAGSEGEGQQAQQVPQEQQQGQRVMDVDAGAQPSAAGSSAEVPGSGIGGGSAGHVYVARSYASMAAALQGSASASAGGGGSIGSGSAAVAGGLVQGSLPVAAAFQQGLLMWRPTQQQAGAAAAPAVAGAGAEDANRSGAAPSGGVVTSSLCLVEAAVHPVKTGALAEGAAIVVVAGWEARRCRHPLQVLTPRQQRRRQRELEEQRAALAEAGGNPAEALGSAAPSGGGSGEVGEEDVQVVGFVLSQVPRGAPRRCGALAAVSAAAAWRLRLLQHGGAAQGGAAGILAFARNPGSAALFPVRMVLAVEQAA